jgi:hypothetical protein
MPWGSFLFSWSAPFKTLISFARTEIERMNCHYVMQAPSSAKITRQVVSSFKMQASQAKQALTGFAATDASLLQYPQLLRKVHIKVQKQPCTLMRRTAAAALC